MVRHQKKEKRLRFLKDYWQKELQDIPNIIINTPSEKSRSCGIGNVGVKNINPSELANILFKEFKIFTVAIDYANVRGCRISPNVFTSIEELDVFISSMKTLSKT